MQSGKMGRWPGVATGGAALHFLLPAPAPVGVCSLIPSLRCLWSRSDRRDASSRIPLKAVSSHQSSRILLKTVSSYHRLAAREQNSGIGDGLCKICLPRSITALMHIVICQ